MLTKSMFTAFLAFFFTISLFAQETTVFNEANLAYKRGMDFYEKGLYGQAQAEFRYATHQLEPVNEPNWNALKKEAELYYAKCAVNLKQPEAEKLISSFLAENSPSPAAAKAAFEIANYYYNSSKYKEAYNYFTMLNPSDLSRPQMAEANFKMGYCSFVQKKFTRADKFFAQAKANQESKYYFPANYYHGMIAFFGGKFDEAVSAFKVVDRSRKYKPYIPFYLAQIYFSQGKYDEVIDYGSKKVKGNGIRKKGDINLLIGKSYYAKGEFDNALPYLEAAAKKLNKMTPEDFYQLAFTQYRAGNCEKSIKNFSQLTKQKSKIGQLAMYYMADCNIKLGKKSDARNALKKASELDFDQKLRIDALYNYGKLSYELGYDMDALSTFQKLSGNSKYGAESQKFMSAIFLNTRDYARALNILENLPDEANTPKMKETYQKVALYRGIQLYNNGDLDGALRYFEKSRSKANDPYSTALAYYWEGEILHQKGKYKQSKEKVSQFLAKAKNLRNLPEESSYYAGNYLQGYNYLKLKDYNRALKYFQATSAEIRRQSSLIDSKFVRTKMLGDAVVREGDCYFKKNQYSKSVKLYDEAVRKRYPDFVYALYQKAIVQGLRGKTVDKIISLENLAKNYPKSPYADDALFQTGVTYMEIDKNAQAKKPLKKLVKDYKGKSPLYNQALLRLGLIAYNSDQYDVAADYYKRVFANNPEADESKSALAALKEIYVTELGQPEKYSAFLETIPGYKVTDSEKDQLAFSSAESQYENGNYAKAIKAFGKYLDRYPNGQSSLKAHYFRGESYGQLKKYDNALKDFEAVVKKGNSKYYLKAVEKAASIAYNINQDFPKAFGLYKKWETAAVTPEKKLDAQQGALQCAYRIHDENAVKSMAIKIANNPNATDGQKAIAFFYQGKLAFDNKNYDVATKALNKVTRLSDTEETAEARYLIAYIYYVRRELDIASAICEKATSESQGYDYWIAKSLILYADILTEQGNYTNARAALETVIENFQDDDSLLKEAKTKLKLVKAKESSADRLLKSGGDDGALDLDAAPN